MKNLALCIAIVVIMILGTIGSAAQFEGLVLYLRFDEGSGDKVADLSGNGNDGKLNGPTWTKNGKIGSAISFDVGNYVEVPHSSSLSLTDAITIMAWTNMKVGSSGEMAIVSKGQWAANDLPYELTETNGGIIYWQFYNDAGRDSCSANSPAPGEWHHIAGTYNGEVFELYIDGKMVKEWQYKGKMPENTASVTIGKRSKANECFFSGMIDEVVICNRALSVEEIKEIMEGANILAIAPKDKSAATWGAIKN